MKKLKHIIAIFCILLCFVPTTAYAAEKVTVADVECRFYSTGGSIDVSNQSIPFRIESTKPAKNLSSFSVGFKIDSRINDGDTINLDKKYWNYWSHVNYSVYLYHLNANGSVNNNSRVRVYYKYNVPIEEYNGMISFNATKDYSNGCYLEMVLDSKEVYPDYAESTFTAGVDYITYAIEHKTNSLLNNIISQIKEIINNIKEIPHKIGDFITRLGDRIGSFFTDLWDKIITKFNEFELKVKTWWSNLSQSLKDWWTNLTTSIKNWWQSIIDYLKSLFVPDPNYWTAYKDKVDLFIQEHFGFLYQSGNLIVSLFETIKNGISNASPSGVIRIPEIKWIFTQNSVLVPATDFNLDTIVNAKAITKSVFNMIKIAINALICYSVVLLGKKKFDEIILDREVL